MVAKFFKIIFKISIVSSLIFCFFTPVYALTEYTELVDLPGTTIVGPCPAGGCTANIQTYLPGVFKLAIGLSAVLAFVMITFGGIMYATSDAIQGKEEGKDYIYNAVKGLILVIGAWAILYTINPKTLEFNLTLPVPKLATSTPSITSGANGGALLQTTERALFDLTAKCTGCVIRVTSTTGDSHDPNSLHYQGRAVDIAPDSKLNAFVSGSTATIPACKTFVHTLGGVTTTFLWEETGSKCGGAVASTGSHWHVSVAP